jgi:hypothetical protein
MYIRFDFHEHALQSFQIAIIGNEDSTTSKRQSLVKRTAQLPKGNHW